MRMEDIEKEIKELISNIKPKLFISGHSHILKVIYDDKNELLHINPGAAGKHGFHHEKTIVRFELKNARVENLEVVKLGKRAKI